MLGLRHALALGALQGPAELMPVSSSGHIALVPELLGWPYADVDPELRKSFEVALHAGTAAALAWVLRDEVAGVVRGMTLRRAVHVAVEFAPAAAAGLAFERPIERRLGTVRTVAAAQVAAGALLWWADRAPARRPGDEATVRDHLVIGLAQATALIPGVSRNGATLTAARLLRFRRRDASRLSRRAALPIILGATALKGARLARRGLPPGTAGALSVGAAAAFASTLASARIVEAVDNARSYRPFAAYRIAIGLAALSRGSGHALQRNSSEAPGAAHDLTP
ncbi:MAG: undecaprenyl-diphosphate phosphatase [Thermoleophilaceae bacterium]